MRSTILLSAPAGLGLGQDREKGAEWCVDEPDRLEGERCGGIIAGEGVPERAGGTAEGTGRDGEGRMVLELGIVL